MQQAVFGGGCFWCLEPVFRALRGVVDVMPGYSGGHVQSPSYEQVCRQDTGHVEVVRVSYDASLISYRSLLEVFFAIHDPTTADRQGNDVGPQYASVIFYSAPHEREVAAALLHELQPRFAAPICTRIEALEKFWPAEQIHRQYFSNNPDAPYCQYVIAPKLADFMHGHQHLLG